MLRNAVIASIVTLVSCATASSTPGGNPYGDGSDDPRITIIVQNQNFADARLFALRRGARSSLGVVGGKSDAEFKLDWNVSEPLQIEIDLLAGPRCTTEELRADPGDIFELQIWAVFRDSPACRRD